LVEELPTARVKRHVLDPQFPSINFNLFYPPQTVDIEIGSVENKHPTLAWSRARSPHISISGR
jgi:hypothetical protein